MGSVQVVDFSEQKVLARHASGAAALVAASASDAGEFFVISATKFNDCRLQLSRWRDGRFENVPDFGLQAGWPHSVVPASNGKRLIVSLSRDCNRLADLRNQIAVVNLSTAKVEREISVGRKGVRIAKWVGKTALFAAFPLPTIIVGVAIYAVGGLPPRTIRAPERIWVGEDGAPAFGLDTDSNDVTVLEIDSGRVLGHTAVGGGPLGLLATPSGGLLLAVARYQLTWMDLQSGKVQGQHTLEGESISAAFSDERGKRIILLTDKGVLTWYGDRPGAPRRANALRGRLLLPVTRAF
jgi:DNA-binding beta-propeller fold protein YncE